VAEKDEPKGDPKSKEKRGNTCENNNFDVKVFR
jgi:hypothetical protein